MSGKPGLCARTELTLYRAAAALYRLGVTARLAVGGDDVDRRHLRERLGDWQVGALAKPMVWVHAASLGETLTAAPLIDRLKARGCSVVVTCQTATGYAAARRTAADEVHTFPVDTPGAIRRVLADLRPSAFVFVETEIWPSLLLLLAEAGVPSMLVNATVSERSSARYRYALPLVSAALGTLSGLCARDAVSLGRLLSLGAPADRAIVTGDLKSDAFDEAALAAVPDLLAGVPAPILVAASTHQSEDDIVVDAFAVVRAGYPQARLVLAPRHPERAAAVVHTACARGFDTRLRSRGLGATGSGEGWDVLVVDTTGELRGFMRSARAVFVGGSLVNIGGHNLFEPAAFGCPVATGPSSGGVREQAEALLRCGALAVVSDTASLARFWTAILDDPSAARGKGEAARRAVRESGGALERTMGMLVPLLGCERQGKDETEA